MERKSTGLSTDFVIHPGETLLELINDRNITQSELAIKTGLSAAYISNVINGKKNITPSLANKLEYVLGIPEIFWLNLQTHYDAEIAKINEVNNITDEEISILNNLSEVIKHFISHGIIKDGSNSSIILALRRLFGISNLTIIPKLTIKGAFRTSTKHNVDIYVLYAWLKMCELKVNEIKVDEALNIPLLKNSIEDIKRVMFFPVETMEAALTNIFQRCGIAFCIVKNFKNAPVQGYIKKTEHGNIIFCMTIRQSFADIFWFTLFHEMAHIFNGDYEDEMIDFVFVKDEKELVADKMATNLLIPDEKYETFSKIIKDLYNHKSKWGVLEMIKDFSNKNGVQPYIAIGRLQRDKIIPYTVFSSEKVRYKWAED